MMWFCEHILKFNMECSFKFHDIDIKKVTDFSGKQKQLKIEFLLIKLPKTLNDGHFPCVCVQIAYYWTSLGCSFYLKFLVSFFILYHDFLKYVILYGYLWAKFVIIYNRIHKIIQKLLLKLEQDKDITNITG